MFWDDFSLPTEEIEGIPDNSAVTVWISDNAHEQVGLRLAIYSLQDKDVRISIKNVSTLCKELLNTNELIYIPRSVGEIAPDKLQLMYESDSCELLSTQGREIYTKEWKHISESKHLLRIWENGQIVSVEENHFDESIIQFAKNLHEESDEQFILVVRLISELIGNIDQDIGDSFFEYRIKKLVEDGRFEIDGEFEVSRFYLVRLKG